MGDRELLELAAKAAMHHGMSIIQTEAGPQILDRFGEGYETYRMWRPNLDDGDALRLGAQLGIEYGYGWGAGDTIQRVIIDDNLHVMVENGDVAAAVRTAIVRAAAEIGRTE